MITYKEYSKLFKEFERIGQQWRKLLRELVTELGTVCFDEPFEVAVHSSNGDIYGVHLKKLELTSDGYIKVTDSSGDVYYTDDLDDEVCLRVITEIF